MPAQNFFKKKKLRRAIFTVMGEKSELDKINFIKKLNDAAKLMIKVHYNETEACKTFVQLYIIHKIKQNQENDSLEKI
jgi:ribosomal protein S24E